MPAVPRIEVAALYVHELWNLQRQGRHRRRGILVAFYFFDVIRVQLPTVITIRRYVMREAVQVLAGRASLHDSSFLYPWTANRT
ncbi:MAG: hypothetical protein LZF60_310140 [Nitrospira sp.]|nr:MAG: hypothetical protein LZF60_310140 [Nitrospira sp.]